MFISNLSLGCSTLVLMYTCRNKGHYHHRRTDVVCTLLHLVFKSVEVGHVTVTQPPCDLWDPHWSGMWNVKWMWLLLSSWEFKHVCTWSTTYTWSSRGFLLQCTFFSAPSSVHLLLQCTFSSISEVDCKVN